MQSKAILFLFNPINWIVFGKIGIYLYLILMISYLNNSFPFFLVRRNKHKNVFYFII